MHVHTLDLHLQSSGIKCNLHCSTFTTRTTVVSPGKCPGACFGYANGEHPLPRKRADSIFYSHV